MVMLLEVALVFQR
jgi:hypothetical protein